MDADTYFKAKLYASQIDALNPFRDDRCEMLVHFSGNLRGHVARFPIIQVEHEQNAWIADLIYVFGNAICGKTIIGFSDEDMLAVNTARTRTGLPPL